jgi:hypothetical protein
MILIENWKPKKRNWKIILENDSEREFRSKQNEWKQKLW